MLNTEFVPISWFVDIMFLNPNNLIRESSLVFINILKVKQFAFQYSVVQALECLRNGVAAEGEVWVMWTPVYHVLVGRWRHNSSLSLSLFFQYRFYFDKQKEKKKGPKPRILSGGYPSSWKECGSVCPPDIRQVKCSKLNFFKYVYKCVLVYII